MLVLNNIEDKKFGDVIIKLIICENCNGSYELQPGEILEDFESCECGGILRYVELDGENLISNTENLRKTFSDGKTFSNKVISSYQIGIVAGAVMVIVGFVGWILGYSITAVLIIAGVLVTYFVYKRNLKRNNRSNGDIISKYLRELSRSCIVLKDVNIPGSKDHLEYVVVGSKGIFVIEPKNYSGSLIINGKEWLYKNGSNIQKAYGNPGDKIKVNTRSLLKYLSSRGLNTFDKSTFSVMSCVNPNLTIRSKPRHYDVMHPSNLESYIKSRKSEIPEEDVYLLADLLMPYSTVMSYSGDQFKFY